MRSTLRHGRFPDGRAAGDASLSCPPVNTMEHLKPALPALSFHIVGYGRPAALDCFRQYFAHRPVEPLHPFPAQRRRAPFRMNSRTEKGLVRIDIPNAPNYGLIQ